MFYTIGRLVRKSLPRISSGPVDILTYTEIGLHCFRKMKCKKWKTSCPSLSVNFNFTTTGNNVAISVIGQFAVVDKTTDNAARINSPREGHALKTRFTWRRYCGNKKIDCGLAWSVLLPADPRDWTTFCSPRFEANAWLLNNFSLSALKEKFREQCGKYAERC